MQVSAWVTSRNDGFSANVTATIVFLFLFFNYYAVFIDEPYNTVPVAWCRKIIRVKAVKDTLAGSQDNGFGATIIVCGEYKY